MKNKIEIECEITNKKTILEYDTVTSTFADGSTSKGTGKWHCPEREKNNINEECTCTKKLEEIKANLR